MKMKLTRLGVVGLALVGVLAVGASPAVAKKKKKTRTVTRTATLNTCVNAASPILDFSTATATIPVTLPTFRGALQNGAVTAVNSVSTRITHTFDGDLILTLISPGGGQVLLANRRGSSGDNFGAGLASCSGVPTTFADNSALAISTGTAPFASTFRPELLLSSLVGSQARGDWRLQVTDNAAADTGSLNAFSLNITYTYLASVKKKRKKKK